MSTETRRPPRVHTESPGPLRLVSVELRRLWWRRLSRYGVLLALALVVFSLYGSWQRTQPPSPAERAQQEQLYRQAVADYPSQLASCREAQTSARQNRDPSADFGCTTMSEPTVEMFGPPVASFPRLVTESVEGTAWGAAFFLFLIGASFVAAEFRTGSIGTWLTFEPRRLRVAAAKLTAAKIGALIAAVLLFGVTVFGVWVISQVNGPPTPPVEAETYSPLWTTVRGGVMVTAAGLAGATIALLVRSTAAVIGIVVGYLVAAEGIIANTWPAWQPWLLQLNLRAWLQDGATYRIVECSDQTTGYACSGTEHTLPLSQAWVYLVVVGAVLVAVALVTFRRRDVVA